MSHLFGLMIESLVAVLLLLTIGYCTVLNKRLTRLRADEQTMKATIAELITATEIAERAIGGLKMTVRDCDENLGARLSMADQMLERLDRQITVGEQIMTRISRVALAARTLKDAETQHNIADESTAAAGAPSPRSERGANARALAEAAQALTDRARNRVNGLAA